MSFTSLIFLVFILISAIIYYITPKKMRWIVLLVASIIFYGFYSIESLLFILISAITSFLIGIILERADKYRRVILAMGIVINLGLLIDLKYALFIEGISHGFIKSINLLSKTGIIIPLGLSFYTLSIIGYMIDVYRKKYTAEMNIGKYCLFVTYFPHILQGPIARYNQLGHQLWEVHKFDYTRIKMGFQLMLWGYFKKMVIADKAGVFVDYVYSNQYQSGGTTIFIASILYSIQIYADFSGCVDIARGVSEIFGIELMKNFEQPYFSKSINEFWRRWHISLSSWFRDYLYIPLGGNRKGAARRWINVLIVFAFSGIWHGVGLTFMIWGILHGIYQIVGYLIAPAKNKIVQFLKINTENIGYRCIQTIITFLLVNFAWIFFRSADYSQALYMIQQIFTNPNLWVLFNDTLFTLGLEWKDFAVLGMAILMMFVIEYKQYKGIKIRETINKQNLVVRWTLYYGIIFAIIIFGTYGIGYSASNFIYMNF